EVEKAHPDVLELFYQVFDKGSLEDGEGTSVDFRNTVILLTTNLGSETIWEACAAGARPDTESLAQTIRPELVSHFKPALLGRMVAVPYFPLKADQMERIVRLKLAKIAKRFEAQHRAAFSWDDALVSLIASRAGEMDSGARMVDNILTGTLLPDLSIQILDQMAEGEAFETVHVSVDGDGGFRFEMG
ncbi:MAG: AAA family ATPase, partial [Rhodospirillales bacterium]